jgi:hypothetical protein
MELCRPACRNCLFGPQHLRLVDQVLLGTTRVLQRCQLRRNGVRRGVVACVYSQNRRQQQ